MWNLIYSNKTCNEFNRFKEYLERLSQTRHVIDTSSPHKPNFLKNNTKKKVTKRETDRVINYENRLLYHKMQELGVKPSPYSPCMNIPSKCPAFDRNAIDFNKKRYQSELLKNNKKLRLRFQSAKPTYNTKQMIRESSYNDYLKKNISNFTRNPSLNYATYSHFRKSLSIVIERDNPYKLNQNKEFSFTLISNNKQLTRNMSAMSHIYASRSFVSKTVGSKKLNTQKTKVTNSTLGNTTTITK